MPIPVPDFGMLEFALSSSLIKGNAELQDGITCQRVFHFLPLSDDGDWNEKSSLRTNVSVLRTRICLQRKQSAQRSAFLLLRVPLLNWIQSAILPQAHPPLWNCTWAFPLWFLASQVVLEVKNLLANAGDAKDAGLIPGSGRAPGVGHGNALQYSFLGNSTDRGAWRATSMWSQRIRHNWAGNTHTHTHTHTHTLNVTFLVQHCYPSSEKAAPVTFLWALIWLIVYTTVSQSSLIYWTILKKKKEILIESHRFI